MVADGGGAAELVGIAMNDAGAMSLAVAASTADGLEASVSAHFGHCPYFVFVSIAADGTLEAESVANPFAQAHAPGQLPNWIAERGASAVIAGGMGGGAIQWFTRLGIMALTGCQGSVGDAVAEYRRGVRRAPTGCAGHGQHDCEGGAHD